MNIVYLGSTKFSENLLAEIYVRGMSIKALFTIPEEFNISYSQKKVKNYNFADLSLFADVNKIPCYLVDSKNGQKITDYKKIISDLQPDVILVMGWYYMVPASIRKLAKHGAWGIHASLLPDYAGGAPLVWAMIEGQKKTGVTLFRLEDGVDDGDIIAQREFLIDDSDSIREVYEKATQCSKDILVESLLNIESVKYLPQDKTKIKIYPQRKPEDGEIDLAWDSKKIHDFIRAQAPPYPGAFIKTKDGKKVIIEKSRLEDL